MRVVKDQASTPGDWTAAYSLRGTTALVTGAGRGIGAATAQLLAEAGAELFLLSRTASDLDAVAERIRLGGGEARVAICDVCDKCIPSFQFHH